MGSLSSSAIGGMPRISTRIYTKRGCSAESNLSIRRRPPQAQRGVGQEFMTTVYASGCFENVWMPHSSFVPPQRPDLGLFGSTGSAVQGWHPILKYPSSY